MTTAPFTPDTATLSWVADRLSASAANAQIVQWLRDAVKTEKLRPSPTPPADDVRELIAEARRFQSFKTYQYPGTDIVRRLADALEVRPRGTVTDAASVLADPQGGCACEPFDQDAGGGYTEHLLEYEPDCPVHSKHLYDPRIGQWILRDKFEAAQEVRS